MAHICEMPDHAEPTPSVSARCTAHNCGSLDLAELTLSVRGSMQESSQHKDCERLDHAELTPSVRVAMHESSWPSPWQAVDLPGPWQAVALPGPWQAVALLDPWQAVALPDP